MNSNELEIIKTLTPYMLAFPQSKMNAQSLVIYAKALSSLSLAEIDVAMTKLLRTMKFFPSVAEIFEQAETMTRFVNADEDKLPDEAWSEVVEQMHDAFVYKKPVFSTPEIEKAALSMGWIPLCEMPVDGTNTARAQFLKMYESVLKRKREGRVNRDVLAILPADRVQALMKKAGAKLTLVSGGK